ncbi:anti-sigma-28 factor FlgM [Oxobacter pfennigii]|uniref:Negative regulator of flagellin synthesis n=1 Tax=Oxobacter pfennigii TaxID=36849 RepID=A0A0P9AGU0_9CLOT|nr:flagellar biosynthesis anti-sigma factor FlgM [Oxobacter pfennigii]KPU44659.1 anti-sigma-28 factor FlgM [Oxobacter pfennigii]
MKITSNNRIEALKAYNSNKIKSGMEKSAGKRSDSIEISLAGHEIAKYISAAREIPDVRLEKVNEIKAKIQKGTYNVSAEDLALKMLNAMKEGM